MSRFWNWMQWSAIKTKQDNSALAKVSRARYGDPAYPHRATKPKWYSQYQIAINGLTQDDKSFLDQWDSRREFEGSLSDKPDYFDWAYGGGGRRNLKDAINFYNRAQSEKEVKTRALGVYWQC